MSIKGSISLQFNDTKWQASLLGEHTILLECSSNIQIEEVHRGVHLIEKELGDELKDIVPSYQSIAVFSSLSIKELSLRLNGKTIDRGSQLSSGEIIELPICYEFGLDLDRISNHTSLSREQIINYHLQGVYRSLFMGFTPGFIYSDGLDPRIECPRLASPRKRLPNGSIGIAGNQTGIYSLASPGGWNIIGRTPVKIFESERKPPMLIDVGKRYRFYRISESQFESWVS